MKKNKNLSFILLALITALQMVINEENFLNSKSDNEDKPSIVEEYNHLTFEELYSELREINGLRINNLENKEECWQVSVTISGDESKIKDILKSLSQYTIKEYTITGEKNLLSLTMEMRI